MDRLKENFKAAFKNISYTFSANLFSVAISGAVALLAPKFLDLDSYGYWQLYIFYFSYVGFFHLGLQDGMYLRYGGQYYESLDKKVMHSQFTFLVSMEFVFAVLLAVYATVSWGSLEKRTVIFLFAIVLVVYLPNSHLQYVLQMTNRIKEYSFILILEKFFYALFVAISFFQKQPRFEHLLLGDIFAKIIALVVICFICRDIVLSSCSTFLATLQEAWKNISVGLKLLLANLASSLITGILRFFIEQKWDITVFGKTSLSFTLCAFVLSFVIVIGQAIFPLLKRAELSEQITLYNTLNTICTLPLLTVLIFYQPLVFLLSKWLPEYQQSFQYFILLMPLCIAESKSALLTNTYFKTLRRENLMLKLNLCFVIICLGVCYFTIYILSSLELGLLSVTILSVLRCATSEILVAKILKTHFAKPIFVEIFSYLAFLWANWYLEAVPAMMVYAVVLVVSITILQKEWKQLFSQISR